MTTEAMQVAKTILEQLGGNKFCAMTGAKNFVGSADALSFQLPGGGGFTKNDINGVTVRLTADDLYTMIFWRIRARQRKEIAKHEGVYFEQLQEIFEKETGLRTRLF